MAKEKRATWWKMFSHQRAVIESVSDADVGKGLKAAFRYFDDGEINPEDLSQAAFTIFCVMRPYIDESKKDYEESVLYGRRGGLARTGNGSPPNPPLDPLSPPIAPLTEAKAEADAEAEADTEREGEGENTTDKPARSARFVPPTVEEVRAYCQERQNGIDAQRFVDYYASNGWKVGKNAMKDWKASVRTWETRDRQDFGAGRKSGTMPTAEEYLKGGGAFV